MALTEPDLLALLETEGATRPSEDPTAPPAPPELPDNRTATPEPRFPTVTVPRVDPERVERVRDLFYRARAARQPVLDQWVRNYEIIHNRPTWSRQFPSPHRPDPPEIWPIVNSIVAWESDSAPTFEATPAADPNSPTYAAQYQLGADLTTAMRAAHHANSQGEQFQIMLWDGNVYGIGILKTVWDAEKHLGLGDAITRRVDPFTFYPDPDATSIENASYLIEAQELNDQQLEMRFPGALKVVGTAAGVDEHDRAPTLTGDRKGELPKANPGPMAGVSNKGYGLPGQNRHGRMGELRDTDSDRHLILECWWKRMTEDGPRWWVTVVCGNAVLLEIPASDAWGHGDQPYDRWVPVETGEFWAVSLVELLTPMQLSINRILSAIENNLELAGNPIFLEDRRAGISRQKIVNRPGIRVPKNAGAEVRWLDPPQIHPDLALRLVDFYVGEMERVSGLSAIVRGATPTGRNSEGVLGSVQEAAFVRIRMALRNLEVTLARAGNKQAALIAEFYDQERVISFTGPSGEHLVRGLRGKHFYVPDPNSDHPTPMKFALHVRAGSTNPTSRQERAAEADTLFAMGAIDEEAVLQAHEFPNWPQVTARIREMKAQAGQLGQPPTARAAAGRTT